MNGIWTCSKLGLYFYMYMLLLHFRRFSIVYSLVQGRTALSGNDIIHNLQLREPEYSEASLVTPPLSCILYCTL
jgi:hypothetical protein